MSVERVLVANRGEIAVRIIKTLHSMGMTSIAVYSAEDATAQHTVDANVALPLAGATVAETYLSGSQILALARQARADAIITGYGFLAENADFAAAVEAAGLTWIGPTPLQMRELGLKHRARDIAVQAGVPVVPGTGLLATADDAVAAVEGVCRGRKSPYPVVVKSTAGGGGIGLRVCRDEGSLRGAFESVKRLAGANFGDDGVFLERYVERARHIEVQIVGDGQGKVVALGERDCTLQRRNQKVIEECPASFASKETREKMRTAAMGIASAVKYRNVGTVEFIQEVDTGDFFFLEVNTRLQVEHPVTEEAFGLDLVKCMVDIARGEFSLRGLPTRSRGHSIEARIYAERPLQKFQPCTGKLTDVAFPTCSGVRVDTWVKPGTEIVSSYDPLIAKIITSGDTRAGATRRLINALESSTITGVETNVKYLIQLLESPLFTLGNFTTDSLDSFQFHAQAIEVVDAGACTTVQDYPGREGLWHIGVPPSGPLDSYSFRLANRLVGNDAGTPALECTAQGPSLLFHSDCAVAVVGASADVLVEGCPTETQQFTVRAGETLSVGTARRGYRCYVAIQGGIDVPRAFGSCSTFPLGRLGGYNGRALQKGDIVRLKSVDGLPETTTTAPRVPIPYPWDPLWEVAVMAGPHGYPDFFTSAGFKQLFASEWTVHYNSNRLGIRLTGPRPEWARSTGGEAGLHPSNIHDSPYPIGGVSFTGDEAVVLTCDGPSLGGFVVFATVISADMWKFGQMRPGDRLRLVPVTARQAVDMGAALDQSIHDLSPLRKLSRGCCNDGEDAITQDRVPNAVNIGSKRDPVLCRQAGDCAVLLEFGTHDGFDLRQTVHIATFVQQHAVSPIPGVEELAPGVRTLLVRYAPGILPCAIIDKLRTHAEAVGSSLPLSFPSRRICLPLAFDDSVSRAAIDRYAATIRSSAPYLPSNIDFLRELNFPDDEDGVADVLHSATFLVLGLGDVFLGSPCAVPLDPRHRLFGTKYNPSRSFTGRGCVGIGGQYMCIYAAESPGGYQLVGRTVPIWAEDRVSRASGSGEGGEIARFRQDAWMFRLLDRISFYPISEAELDAAMAAGQADALVTVADGMLDLEEHEAWLETIREDFERVARRRAEATRSAPFYEELLKPFETARPKETKLLAATPRDAPPGERVRAHMPGRCWKCDVKEGSVVEKGDALIWIESNKMELKICSPVKGVCAKVFVEAGDVLDPFDDVAIITTTT